MADLLLGKKLGMTQVFNQEDNKVAGVTVIEAGPCRVVQIKDKTLLVGFGDIKESKVKKSQLGLFKKSSLSPSRILKEVQKIDGKEYKVGDELKVDIFAAGDFVDVGGISIGKGFQGGMKRWNWHGQPASHGHTSHRRVGSMGSTTTPGRVLKGHHLPGHMGNAKVMVKNLKVINVDAENNLLVVKGAVPGHKDSIVGIRKSYKSLPKKAKK